MKKVEEPNAIFKCKGKPVKVIGINESHRSIIMEYLDEEDSDIICKNCGNPVNHQFNIIESSPLFQENAKRIETLRE
jgi:hypothetical protein